MSHFRIPQTFGDRPCDRLLLSEISRHEIDNLSGIGMMFRVWRDFASGRSDRRVVPRDPQKRQSSQVIEIIEDFCGWLAVCKSRRGAFVEAAVESGFFILVDESADESSLVLADFYPLNQNGDKPAMSASRIGGLRKGVNYAANMAEAHTREQMEMFVQVRNPVLAEIGETALRDAMLMVHQLCTILRREKPRSEFWQREIAAKAHATRNSHSSEDRDRAFAWLAANRDSPEIPSGIEMVLDRFGDYVRRGRKEFGV